MAQPLEVLADLQLAVDGKDVDIQADGDHIVVDVPSLQVGRRLMSSGPLAQGGARTSRRVHKALSGTGLSAEIRLNGTPFARLGRGAHPGRLERLFGLPGVELSPTEPVRAAARRRPLFTAAVLLGLVLLIGRLVVRYVRS